jgi:hypothetical protein
MKMRVSRAIDDLGRAELLWANQGAPAVVISEDNFGEREAHAQLVLAGLQVDVPGTDGGPVTVLAEVEPGVQIACHEHRIGASSVDAIRCGADSISVVLGGAPS